MTTSVETRHRPKGDKRARTRAALIEAARELIHETGYEHVTMEAVARRAGMTRVEWNPHTAEATPR